MKKMTGAFAFLLAASLGLACSGNGLKSQGQGGQSEQGGAVGSGGAGGAAAGGAGGAGGWLGGGGQPNAGGAGGGTTCRPMGVCPAIACLYGEMPNPDPCGCPICARPEAGACPPTCPAVKCAAGSLPGKDACGCPLCAPPDAAAPPDAPPDACLALPCMPPETCGPGYELVEVLCGCPTCFPVDAGQPDGITICPRSCPAVKCAAGSLPGYDVCGCPACVPPPDAGTDNARPACVGLDECTCADTTGCSLIAEPCYCPFPQCGSGACFCGGGRYVGCAPVELASCASAKARIGALCPQLHGATFDSLCTQSDADCVTECLNEVTTCTDVACSFCEACDCATDRFSTCRGKCQSATLQ